MAGARVATQSDTFTANDASIIVVKGGAKPAEERKAGLRRQRLRPARLKEPQLVATAFAGNIGVKVRGAACGLARYLTFGYLLLKRYPTPIIR